MDRSAKQLFSAQVLELGASCYGIDPGCLSQLAGFENLVYAGRTEHGDVVLRFTHCSHRTRALVEAELDWLSYLRLQGAAVCGPLPSPRGLLLHTVPVRGGYFVVSAFERAPAGASTITPDRPDDRLARRWGQATGQLHRLSAAYRPPAGSGRRYDYMELIEAYLDRVFARDPQVKSRAGSLVARIRALPRSGSNFMLCHTDLHQSNFHYDGARLWIFDFDDCAYNYAVHDLAMPLYYLTWRLQVGAEQLRAFATRFFSHYLAGYLSEYLLPLEEILQLPLFLRLRDCDLLGILVEEEDDPTEFGSMIPEIRARVLDSRPVVDLDYPRLYAQAAAGVPAAEPETVP